MRHRTIPRLHLRGSASWFRMAVPKPLRRRVGLCELTGSLRTTGPFLARSKCRIMSVLRALSDLSEDELTQMVQDHLVTGMKKDMDDFLGIKPEGPEQHQQDDYLQQLKDMLQASQEDAVGTTNDLETGTPEHVARIALDLLQRQRIETQMQSIQYDRLIRRLRQAEMHRERQRAELYASKLEGGSSATATPFDNLAHQILEATPVASMSYPPGVSQGPPPIRKQLTVAQLIKVYEKEPNRRNTIVSATSNIHPGSQNLICRHELRRVRWPTIH